MHERYLCLHGHFYQPPRENPWLGAVEVQDSAAPYHDWNERITMECYGPNTAARITTWDGKILDIRNNFSKISFNFGPTLLQWMEINRPEVYEDIIEADRMSVLARGGHGNSLAQGFNHTILPLASDRERLVQVVWGLEDFRERFGRDPEGMWLPETAADLRTLDCLASNGVKFTVLAPRQARRFRPLNEADGWMSCDGGQIDPTRPYVCTLPSGKSIVLFFYDGPISQGVAFEGLLNDGGHFASRLMQGFSAEREWPELLSIATDGESYGHHHTHGEMALAYALHVIEREGLAHLTNYGEYLSHATPTAEVQIWNNSSWSCVHGVDRWRGDCGCNSGTKDGWHQKWRGSLRDAFRLLASKADDIFDHEAPKLLKDPEAALLDYVHVLLDQTPTAIQRFLTEHALRTDDSEESVRTLRLMEIMRNAQLIFTSCAWFFDEVSGLETVQNMKYAGRLLQLLRPYDIHLEAKFLHILEKTPSNLPKLGNAAECYRLYVKPNIIDLHRVVAHHAIVHFDVADDGAHRLFCYELHVRDAMVSVMNGSHMKLCRLTVRSLVDGAQLDCTAIVLHFGGHDFRCSITGPMTFEGFEELKEELLNTYQRRSLTELVRVVDEHFGRHYFNLEHVFSEGKRELLQRVTMEAFQRFDNTIRMIFEENRKLMDYLQEAGAPLPQGFISAAEFVLKTRLLEELDSFVETGDPAVLQNVGEEACRYRVRLNDPLVTRRLEQAMERIFHQLALAPSSAVCRTAIALIEVLEMLQLKLDNWEAQNIVFALIHGRPLPAHLARQVSRVIDIQPPPIPELHELAEKLRVGLEAIVRTSSSLQMNAPMARGGSSERIVALKS